MSEEDHTFECALLRTHDGQCANVPPAPPLADAADPGYAARLDKLRDRAEAIVKADPAPGSRADREEDRDIKEALRLRAETHPEDPQPVMRCEATYGTGDMRCVGVAGHSDAHSALCPPGSVQWTDADNAEPLPQREPGAALNCPWLSPHGDVCTLTRGHKGMHERHWLGKHVASWEGSFTANPVNDASSWIGKAFGGLGGPGVMRILDDPKPVRVRFVDLPSTPANPTPPGGLPQELRGLLSGVMRPGGFALVVDRFRHLAHRDNEKALWENFAGVIGAKTLILYVGTLDIEPVDWE